MPQSPYGPYASGYQFPDVASKGGSFGGISGAGTILQIAGAAQKAIGAYYDTLSRRYGARSAALQADLEASTSTLNARAAEDEAELFLQQGAEAAGLRGLQGAAEKGAYRASTAAHGVRTGVGSSAEVATAIEFAADQDALTIRANAARAAGSSRLAAVNLRNRAASSRLSADILRRQARLMNPTLSAVQSLIGSGAEVAPQWIYQDQGGR